MKFHSWPLNSNQRDNAVQAWRCVLKSANAPIANHARAVQTLPFLALPLKEPKHSLIFFISKQSAPLWRGRFWWLADNFYTALDGLSIRLLPGSSEESRTGVGDPAKLGVKKPRPKASSPNRQGPQQCQVRFRLWFLGLNRVRRFVRMLWEFCEKWSWEEEIFLLGDFVRNLWEFWRNFMRFLSLILMRGLWETCFGRTLCRRESLWDEKNGCYSWEFFWKCT